MFCMNSIIMKIYIWNHREGGINIDIIVFRESSVSHLKYLINSRWIICIIYNFEKNIYGLIYLLNGIQTPF